MIQNIQKKAIWMSIEKYAIVPYISAEEAVMGSFRKPFESSFKTQWADLTLTDFTDIFGVSRFQASIKDLKVKNPHFYRVSNGGSSFKILGSFHDLPLHIFPAKILEQIFTASELIVECISGEGAYFHMTDVGIVPSLEFEVEDVLLEGVVEKGGQSSLSVLFSESYPEWLESLSIKCQKYVTTLLLMYECNWNGNLEDPFEVADYIASICQQVLYPMDQEIIDVYRGYFTERRILCLEFRGEQANELYSKSETQLLREFEESIDEIPDLLPSRFPLINSYINGSFEDDNDPFVKERSEIWVRRLEYSLSNGPLEGPIISTGEDHLYGPHGVLTLFAQSGWTVERYDNEANLTEASLDQLIGEVVDNSL